LLLLLAARLSAGYIPADPVSSPDSVRSRPEDPVAARAAAGRQPGTVAE
jgi:hypothetical protein